MNNVRSLCRFVRPLQKYEGVIHVQARRIEAIQMTARAASSHDFK